ncbi:MFS transporter [Kitasatospora sp. NPDC006697]|uniref:MFS transporter n=1 Tax=Kitasatospora sp. NPDC006697 TaxID=3364020 RepID=UPI0036896283
MTVREEARAPGRAERRGPDRSRGFPLLWGAQTVSLLGSQVTLLALPLMALTSLHADPLQVGILTACGRAPYLVLGLPSGVLVDRLPKRRLLVACNLLLGTIMMTVPAAALAGRAGLVQLYAVATAAGAVTVILDVAYLAFVPTVVDAARLVKAQSALEFSQSAAMALGPPLAGWLIGRFSAPTAVSADAGSFLLAAAVLALVAAAPVRGPAPGRGVVRQVADGVRTLAADRILRSVTLATGTFMFCYSAYSAVLLVYLTQRVGLSAGTIGIAMGIGALGGVAGALAAPALARALGLGRVLMAALAVSAAAAAVAPAVLHPHGAAIAGVFASQFVLWFGQQTYNVHQVPVRYALAPAALHGRINATIRTLVWSLASLGALVGGVGGQWAGTRTTLLLSAAGGASAILWIARSPLRHVRAPALAAAPAAQQSDPAVPEHDGRPAQERPPGGPPCPT